MEFAHWTWKNVHCVEVFSWFKAKQIISVLPNKFKTYQISWVSCRARRESREAFESIRARDLIKWNLINNALCEWRKSHRTQLCVNGLISLHTNNSTTGGSVLTKSLCCCSVLLSQHLYFKSFLSVRLTN